MSLDDYLWGQAPYQLRRAIDKQQTDAAKIRRLQWSREQSQEDQIAALMAEITDLKSYIGGLCAMLIDKGTLTERELADLAASVYPPPPPEQPAPAVDPTLAAIEQAVEETNDRT